MKKVTFDLPVFNPLNEGPMKIGQHAVSVEIELTDGEHLFTSSPIEIGTFFHYKVFGNISIPYIYDSELQYVTIAGVNSSSDNQLTIHISLDQHPKIVDSRNLNSVNIAKGVPTVLTDFINNTPEVKQANQIAIRQTLDAFVNEILNSGVQGVIQTSSAPIVGPQNYQDYKAMFLPEKKDVDLPSLDDLLEVQTIVESTFYGTITWPLNYSFANIIGSTHDPKPYGYSSWIQLWADTCNGGNYTTHCSSFNYSDGAPPFGCNITNFVGGHVIPGITASPVATGSTAYIFPICKAHNNNDNIFMSMRYNPVGVVLHNYNQ